MSYCRFSDQSDVYLYQHVEGGIVCCACRLNKEIKGTYPPDFWLEELRNKPFSGHYEDSKFRTRGQALKHLNKHKEAGHKVSKYAIDRLNKEILELKNK